MRRTLIAFLCLTAAATAASGRSAPGTPPSGAPGATGPLHFFYDLYTFRGEAGQTRVVAAYAVPAGRLEEKDVDDAVLYRFDVSLVLADTVLQTLVRTDDSVFVGVRRSLDDEHLLFTQVEVQAPPSRNTVQRVVMTDASTPGTGQLYDDAFPIPDYSGTDLMLSDIALGSPDVDGGWRRGNVSLAILPTSQFPASEFDVYYEIYNLPAAARYTTEIAVARLHDDGAEGEPAVDDSPIRLRFAGESSAWSEGWIQELRRVQASLPRGRYRLTVTVTHDATGRTAERSRDFHVRGWKPGATMVPALPRTRAGS